MTNFILLIVNFRTKPFLATAGMQQAHRRPSHSTCPSKCHCPRETQRSHSTSEFRWQTANSWCGPTPIDDTFLRVLFSVGNSSWKQIELWLPNCAHSQHHSFKPVPACIPSETNTHDIQERWLIAPPSLRFTSIPIPPSI